MARCLFLLALAILAGCAAPGPSMTASEGRAMVAAYIPANVADREGWAVDIHSAMAVLEIPLTADNICAILSVTEQESGYRVDPEIPRLSAIAWAEIERQRAKIGVPKLALDAALSLQSSNGKTYRQRIDAAKTERELSETFEDLVGRVPFGRTLFGDRNPVRTGGPMQVSVAFAADHARRKAYPYPVVGSIRDEVFTRRGGMYFGIAHLLDYPAPYDRYLYRYADFNAGHYASRNAAFQAALARVAGAKLDLDGDLLQATEAAARSIEGKLGIDAARIRRDLGEATSRDFERTALYKRVFELADQAAGKPVPRAVVPDIELKSAKFTRKLTTGWFAQRVVTRHRQCLTRRRA